jgi:hypothetical protein
MRAISHRAQAHELLILATTARNVINKALMRKCTMHELSAQAHEPSCASAARAIITALTTTYIDDEIL